MVSIGGRLREKYWKNGIGTDIAKLMVDYLFKETDIEIITASTMVENKASARMLEKNGFVTTNKKRRLGARCICGCLSLVPVTPVYRMPQTPPRFIAASPTGGAFQLLSAAL